MTRLTKYRAAAGLLLLLALFLFLSGAEAQSVARVSSPNFANGASTQFTITSTTGNLSVVIISKNPGDVISGVADSKGNSYQTVGCNGTSPGNTGSEIWFAPNAATGITTVTVTRSTGTGNYAIAQIDVAGASSSAPLSGSPVCLSSQTSTTTPVGPAITTTLAPSVVISIIGSGGTSTAQAPFTAITLNGNGGGGGYIVNAATGTFTPNWSQGAFGWDGVTAAFVAGGSNFNANPTENLTTTATVTVNIGRKIRIVDSAELRRSAPDRSVGK